MFLQRGLVRGSWLAAAVVVAISAFPAAAAEDLSPTSQIVEDLYDTHFLDDKTGWAVGVFGSIYLTTDGGGHWEIQETPTIQHLYSVTFADATNGWAVGRSGEIIRTKDGGRSWARQKSGTAKHLFHITLASPSVAWVVGDWGVVLRTTDGGETWEDRSLAEDQILYSITFADESHGWMVGEFGSVRRTADGGETWTLLNTGTDKTFFGVETTSPDHAWVVGIDGLIVRTADSGETWEIQQGSAEMASFENIGFMELLQNPGLYDIRIEGQKGYIVGDTGNVMLSLDGGNTWKSELLPADWRLSWIRGLHVLPSGWGMIVGAQGLTFVVDGETMRFSQVKD